MNGIEARRRRINDGGFNTSLKGVFFFFFLLMATLPGWRSCSIRYEWWLEDNISVGDTEEARARPNTECLSAFCTDHQTDPSVITGQTSDSGLLDTDESRANKELEDRETNKLSRVH